MGQEILYCFKCQERVTTADLESANALRFGNRTSCRKCFPDLLASLSPEERKDLASRVQSPKKSSTGRFPATQTPRPKAYPVASSRSNPAVLWAIVGVVAAIALIGIGVLMGGSNPAPPPQEVSVAPLSRGSEEIPRERNAREAIARAKSFGGSDLEAQLSAFEQAARTAEGTSREGEAKELRDEFIVLRRKAYAKELGAVEERARVVQQKEEFGAALAIYEAVRVLHPGPEWKALVESKIDGVRKAADAAYAPLKEQAAAAKARGAENDAKSIRERVARWGLADKTADLDSHLKGVQQQQPAPRAGGGQWSPIFDGKSLDFLVMNGEGAWVVENGTLAHVKDRKGSAQTKRQFADGDFRIRFKVIRSSHVGFAVRQSANGYYFVALDGAELNRLDEKEHEIMIFCRGSDVKATLDEKALPVEVRGKGIPSKGPLQFNSYGENFVIKTLEFREPHEAESLMGHWRFDGVSEGQAADASGKGNTATLMEGVVWIPAGRLGGALQFDGRRSHVAVTPAASLAITGPLTISAWVNPRPLADPPLSRAIVEKWDMLPAGTISGYLLRVSNKGHAHFLISEPGKTSEVFGLTPLPSDVWTLVTAVFDGGNVLIYVNGTLERSVPANTPTIGSSTGPFRIGMGGGGGAHFFNGNIDDVRVFNKALSAEEIARLSGR